MSAISSIGATAAAYQPVKTAATQPKPATTPTPVTKGKDPDHDGDTDGPGLDVNG
jgi:hypothetical protein